MIAGCQGAGPPQLQHPGGAVQWQPCTMVELRDHSTTAQHQDHRLPLLRCTMITSSTQCTEVRALNLMRAAREGVEGLREKVCKWPHPAAGCPQPQRSSINYIINLVAHVPPVQNRRLSSATSSTLISTWSTSCKSPPAPVPTHRAWIHDPAPCNSFLHHQSLV